MIQYAHKLRQGLQVDDNKFFKVRNTNMKFKFSVMCVMSLLLMIPKQKR